MIISRNIAITLLAGAWVCQSYAGHQITIQSSTDAGSHGRGKKESATNVVQMTTDAGKARIDFTEGQGPGEKGGYLLTQDSGKTFMMVMPKEKTYMKWDMDSMMNMAGAMGNMMQMKISDAKVETVLDEAGAPLLGYPTRHYMFRTSYRMSMTVMGFKNESTIAKDEEVWATTKLDLSVLGAWAGKMPKTNNENLDQLIQAEKGKIKGIPLKMISVQTATDSQGKISVTKTHMEVTELKKAEVGAVSFEIPSDYQEMSMPMSGGNDEESTQDKSKSKRSSPPKIDFGDLMKKAMEQAR